jgi:hypothetical protein
MIETCPDCHGEGSIPYEGEPGDRWVATCELCEGTGRAMSDQTDTPTTITELIEWAKPHELIHFRDVMWAVHVFGLRTTYGPLYEARIPDDHDEATVVAEAARRIARALAEHRGVRIRGEWVFE